MEQFIESCIVCGIKKDQSTFETCLEEEKANGIELVNCIKLDKHIFMERRMIKGWYGTSLINEFKEWLGEGE